MAAVFALVAGSPPRTASAAAFCSFEEPNTFSPGVSMMPQAYTFTTGGPTGKIDCHGDIRGQMITGPGTLTDDGQADASSTCASGKGTGVYQFQIPTANGPMQLRYPYTFMYGLGLGYLTGDGISGGNLIVPTKGDCLSGPVTEAKLYGMAQLTG